MGITYLKKLDYDRNKILFEKNKYDFKEVRTSNRKFMEFGRTKFYLSDNPARDMACKLLHHELGMIKNVKDYAIKTYMENRFGYMDRVDEKLYIGCCFDQFDSFYSEDIWEIDITSAYPTTALRLGLLSQSNYDKMFEEETSATHIARKIQIKKRYGDNSYYSEGKVLKYSKKCRLISLGSLATKKEIDHYEKGEFVRTELVYDREIANLFYTCAYECGKTMLEIADQVDGVYYWWVDAIFCKESAKDEVIARLNNKGYKVKYKKLYSINYHSRMHQAVVCKNDKKDMHPYFFSMSVDIERIKNIVDTEKDAEAMLNWYKEYIDYPETAQKKIIDKTKSIYGPDATVEQVIFTDLCNILHIETPNDLNLKYLMKVLKDRNLSYSDFIQIRSITTNVVKSMDLERIFGYADERYGADVIALNVCLRAFNPVEKYVSDIETIEEDNKYVGLSKTTIYKQYKLAKLDDEIDDLEYELNNHIGNFTIVEKVL
jgi:hypothetical protein